MIYLNAAITRDFVPGTLPAAVRDRLGKPLRRTAALSQLALLGAMACLPAERRHLPTALLWQSTSGPRQETLALLDEISQGEMEPMPYDFLATQPAIAAAQLQPHIPGLRSATHCPLDSAGTAHWSLLVSLAVDWLKEGRYTQVLCAHLDHWADASAGHWLCLAAEPSDRPLATVRQGSTMPPETLDDTPDVPARLTAWLRASAGSTRQLQSPSEPGLAVEFARLQFHPGANHDPVRF